MKKQSRKLLVGIVFLLIANACTAPAQPKPTPTPDLLGFVKAFENAYTQRDTEGVLALFADNPVWNWGGSVTGMKGLRNVLEYDFEINYVKKFSDCKVENGAVYCNVAISGDCMPPAIEATHENAKFEFKEGKISAIAGWANDLKQYSSFDAYFTEMSDWARQNLPEDYAYYSDPAEWAKLTGTGDPGSGKLSARELGQAEDRICKGYAETIK